MSMSPGAGELDCRTKGRKWKQACLKMGMFPKERNLAGQGAKGFRTGRHPGTHFACGVGAKWLLMVHPTEDQESGEPHLSVLSCKPPNLYKQCLLGAPHFGAHGRQH